MNKLNEKINLTNALEKELENQLELSKRQTDQLFEKLKKIESERHENDQLFSKLKARVSGFKECKKKTLEHLNHGRVDDAMTLLHQEGKKEDSGGYMGLEPQTGHELMK